MDSSVSPEDGKDEVPAADGTEIMPRPTPGVLRDDLSFLPSNDVESGDSAPRLLQDHLCSTVEVSQRELIKSLEDAVSRLTEKVEIMKEEKEMITRELSDLSGSLITEAHNSIDSAMREKASLEAKLKDMHNNEVALKTQNESLRTIIEKKNKTKSMKRSTNETKHEENHSFKILNFPFSRLLNKHFPSSAIGSDSNGDWNKLIHVINPLYFGYFTQWLEEGFPRNSTFFANILADDALPCLSFTNAHIQQIARDFMGHWDVDLSIENVTNTGSRVCDFTLQPCTKCYYVKFDSHNVYVACASARARLVAVIDLYCYIRYVALGIIRSPAQEMFIGLTERRLNTAMVRLGYFRPSSLE